MKYCIPSFFLPLMNSPNLFMRKLPAILIYTALIGFTITAITNILHRRDIGAVTMVASCTALLAGALTAILVSGKKAADNSIKSSGQRTQIIAYVGVIIFVTGILLKKKSYKWQRISDYRWIDINSGICSYNFNSVDYY